MNDDELDNWLLEHNARLVEQTRTSVDLDARRAEVLDRAIPDDRVRVNRFSRLVTLTVALVVAGAVTVHLQTNPFPPEQDAPGTAAPLSEHTGAMGRAPVMMFRQLSGPAGLTTVGPAEWENTPTPLPDSIFEVRDPEEPDRFLRYTLDVSSKVDPSADIASYESIFATRQQNYQLIRLAPTTFDGVHAIEWEYLVDEEQGGGTRHVSALYWEIGSHQYGILAFAPAEQWDDMLPIFDTVRAHTKVTVGAR